MPVVEKTLEQKIAEKRAMKTDWDTDKKDWEYVAIPEENALGEAHVTVSLNGKHFFEPGQTYLVPPAVAVTVKERLKSYAKSCVRILQPNRDIQSERQVAVGTAHQSVAPVDPSTLG